MARPEPNYGRTQGREPPARRGAGVRMAPPQSAACTPFSETSVEWLQGGGRQLLAPRCSTVGHGHAACTITGWAGGNQTCDKPWDSRCKRCCWWPL